MRNGRSGQSGKWCVISDALRHQNGVSYVVLMRIAAVWRKREDDDCAPVCPRRFPALLKISFRKRCTAVAVSLTFGETNASHGFKASLVYLRSCDMERLSGGGDGGEKAVCFKNYVVQSLIEVDGVRWDSTICSGRTASRCALNMILATPFGRTFEPTVKPITPDLFCSQLKELKAVTSATRLGKISQYCSTYPRVLTVFISYTVPSAP